jgi:acetylornithine deacetylase/succinyl-diaminopimelate desuccinylase-like protein
MITAAYAVNKASSLKGDITVAALMGELSGNVGVRHMLKKGVTADIAIVTDCSDLAIVPSEVGKIEGRIVVEGKPDLRHTHINSIEKMYKVINAFGPNYRPIDTDGWVRFKPCDDLPGYPRIAPLAIESPYPGNFCALTFRLITVPGQSIETVRGDLERLMDKLRSEDPDFKAEIKLMEEESTPACYTSTDEPIVRTLAKWHEYVTGEKPKIGAGLRLGWSSVTGYLWKARMKTVSYGPGETPGIDERVKVEDIVTATKAMALTAAEICA